jgi:hypothetical protein
MVHSAELVLPIVSIFASHLSLDSRLFKHDIGATLNAFLASLFSDKSVVRFFRLACTTQPRHHLLRMAMVYKQKKLVSSCRWKCDLGNLSTIHETKILRRQPYKQLP